jgi:hypothetical protein
MSRITCTLVSAAAVLLSAAVGSAPAAGAQETPGLRTLAREVEHPFNDNSRYVRSGCRSLYPPYNDTEAAVPGAVIITQPARYDTSSSISFPTAWSIKVALLARR